MLTIMLLLLLASVAQAWPRKSSLSDTACPETVYLGVVVGRIDSHTPTG